VRKRKERGGVFEDKERARRRSNKQTERRGRGRSVRRGGGVKRVAREITIAIALDLLTYY